MDLHRLAQACKDYEKNNVISESAALSIFFYPPSSMLCAFLQQPVSSESYLRRHCGMMMSRRDVAITDASFKELMTFPRLSLRGRNRAFLWFFVLLPLRQHPVCRLSKMASHRTDSNLLASAASNPFVKTGSVAVGPPTVISRDRVCCLDKCPLQVTVHIGTQLSDTNLPSVRMNAGGGPGVGSKVRG